MAAGDRIDAAENLRIFVRPTGKINQPVDGQGDFLARFGPRSVGRTRDFGDQFGGSILEHFRSAVEDLSAQVGALFGPTLEGRAGGHYRVPEVLARGMAHIV